MCVSGYTIKLFQDKVYITVYEVECGATQIGLVHS